MQGKIECVLSQGLILGYSLFVCLNFKTMNISCLSESVANFGDSVFKMQKFDETIRVGVNNRVTYQCDYGDRMRHLLKSPWVRNGNISHLFRKMSSFAEPIVQYTSPSPGERVAYRQSPGKSPGVIFLPGLMSTMDGTKAVALERYCKEIGHSYVRFDYRGHGMSSGKSQECTIGMRIEDVVTILNGVAKGPQILIGSSLGGWISLLVATSKPDQIRGLIGIASAVDFISRRYETLPHKVKREVERTGKWIIPSQHSEEAYVLDSTVIEEARQHILQEKELYPIHCPVRLLHGMKDCDVPYQVSLDLVNQLESDDVQLTLIKNGGHRLSDPHNLQLLKKTLGHLIDQIKQSDQCSL